MPAVIPVTIPVEEPAVAVVVLLLVQVPPGTPSLKVVVKPVHIVEAPVINVGEGLTVIVAVIVQPVDKI